MSRLSKAVTLGLLTGLVGLALGLLPGGFALEQNIGLDVLFKLRGMRQAPADVVIVSIDRPSAARLNLPEDPEKWPRSLHARLTDNLTKAGAAVIAFDLIFDEARSAVDDQAFAAAVRQARNVVLVEYLRKEIVPLTGADGTALGDLHIEKQVPPVPPLAQAAAATAPFPLPKVPVKVSQYWTFKAGAGNMPTLPVVVFQLFAFEVYDDFMRLLDQVSPSQATKLPRDWEAVMSTIGVEQLIRMLREVFTDEPRLAEAMRQALQTSKALSRDLRQQRMLASLMKIYQSTSSPYLNFYGPPGTISTLPYDRIVQPQGAAIGTQQPLDLQGKVVFVGLSELLYPEKKDGFHTVFSQANGMDISGVEIAATAFANLLEDMPVRPLGLRGYVATLFLWGLLLGVVCRFLPPIIATVTALGLGIVYVVAAQYQFAAIGLWYPLLVPVGLQIPLAFFGAIVWKYADTNRERQNIRTAFGYYLPDTVVEQLSKSVADVKASGRLVYGTCLFTDAEQYTTVAETMEPQELGSFMNTYYETIFEPVRQHGGIVSDVLGDAMLAIWAAAQPDAALREQACLAALEIADAVQRFKQTSGTLYLPTRIGLHAGRMLLGNIGALDHYEYRAVGDIVNTASRLQGLNKYLGTRLLVSEAVLHQLDGFLTRELGTFLLVGKSQPLVVHELLCRMEEVTWQQRRLCAIFAEALDAFKRQSWDEAMQAFEEIIRSSICKEDGPTLFYVEWCAQYRAKPPGASWGGVVPIMKK